MEEERPSWGNLVFALKQRLRNLGEEGDGLQENLDEAGPFMDYTAPVMRSRDKI